ncbi:type 1 glutamine amidotransferase domain-containing protein [Rhizobium sp. BJ04]|uniref:type 1 glutamine amidotransferase domain-containing protein n=1 Tax=Rhizobium binxianense TaxID=3024242 RepID=UPI0023A9ADD2|nr:type 1 glutamine amidotransferase domain-containing protein [Rhizobium sp. BJ04]WEA60413.1 type 1 glutamine amidotransferase domain-containing protein [Rhizobium sp. BJ04]
MSIVRMGSAVLAMGLAMGLAIVAPTAASAQSKGKVLVVMSSAHQLELRDGKTYKTGYFLNELAVPLKQIVDAGYTPVFANPNGDTPQMDSNSNHKNYFGGDDAKRAKAENYINGFDNLKQPLRLSAVQSAGVREFVGVFIPGGHAPMQDLVQDQSLGQILRAFHDGGRPTGIICHGPVALLSTLPDPQAYRLALSANDSTQLQSLSQGWPYAGYRLTAFSAAEEKQVEGDVLLGGNVVFYADEALASAGAVVQNASAPWASNVVVDRELITGQQPMSDAAFGTAFVQALNTQLATK